MQGQKKQDKILNETKEKIAEATQKVENETVQAWDKTKDISSDAWGAAKESVSKAWEATKEFTGEAYEAIKEVTHDAWISAQKENKIQLEEAKENLQAKKIKTAEELVNSEKDHQKKSTAKKGD